MARDSKNEYSYKLSNLLSDHDIYISPTTEKTKDDKEKEVDQICIKVDSYKAIQTQAKKDFDEYMKKVIYDLKNDQNVKYDWAEGTLTYNEKIIYNFKNVKFYDEEGKKCDAADETWKFVALVAEFYCQDHKLPSYGFGLALFPGDVREIQKIVGEKQQAKIKELINGFSKFVDEKIEKHKEQEGPLFRLEKDSIFDYKFDPQDEIDFVMVNDLANEIVEQFITEYFRNKFYINDNTKRLIQKEIEEQENKLKTLFNNAIKEHVEKNKLNYEYDAREDYWKEIPEKNIKNMVGKSEQLANQKNDLEDKKSNNNLSNKELLINLNQHSKIENKIEDKITNNETINEKELEASVNGALQKAKKSLAEKKNGINNETKSVKNDIIIQENKQIEVEIDEKQNNKQDNGNQYSNSIENSNTDENKNRNEIEIKNMEKNNENEDGTKNDTSEKLSNQDKIVEDNDKIDKNKIEENSNNTESQTSDLADKNNQDQSGTKNKGLIKFLTVLKWIALIGFILTLAMTVLSIFIASLSAAIVKFVIAAVVLFFVFVMSKLLVSCLSNKKPKENESPYPKQIYMNLETKENQNELDINKSKHESDINQIGEPKSTISSVIEN